VCVDIGIVGPDSKFKAFEFGTLTFAWNTASATALDPVAERCSPRAVERADYARNEHLGRKLSAFGSDPFASYNKRLGAALYVPIVATTAVSERLDGARSIRGASRVRNKG